MSQYNPSYGQPVGGITWMGSPPRPKPLDRYTAMDRVSRAGDPQARRAEAMKLGLTPMDAPPQSQGGGGGGGYGGGPRSRGSQGGGGGPSYGDAPTNFDNGDRYNDSGYRADGRKKIQGFSADAAGLPDFGGLNEFYANQKGTTGNRTNPAFYAGSEDNNQAFSSPEIAGALDKNNMELVPFAGQIIPVPKRDKGSPGVDPAGMPFAVRRDGEIRVNQDGSVVPLKQGLYLPPQAGVVLTPEQQVTIPQLPNEVVPTEALTMLTDEWARGKQSANDARLAQSGITDYGGGFKALSNPYGTGSAVPAGVPQMRMMADERGQMQRGASGGLEPMPDPLAGTDWGTMNGVMPVDPRIPRAQIDANVGAMQTGAMDRRASDLFGLQQAEAFGLAAQIQQNLKDRTAAGLPMMAPQAMVTPPPSVPGPASQRPATTGMAQPLAQSAALPMIPGLPMSAVRSGQTAMNRYLDSPAGRQAVGQQMLQQAMTPQENQQSIERLIPGTNYMGVYSPQGKLIQALPVTPPPEPQTDEDLLAEAYRVDTPAELRALMAKTKNTAIIKEARARLDKMTTTSTPTKDVYWDSLNQKYVEVDSRYDPPPEQNLIPLKLKAAPGAARMMRDQGTATPAPANPAASKSLIDSLFARPAGR